ncbi:hypothetical protein [Sorangium sp. So ce1335]|uniref:hypothetical protein n=1 Tax=Sorangium sp. So ce1335 TaxID=3133335 RepID=UPI003F6460E7
MQRSLNVLGKTVFLGAMGLLAACGPVDVNDGPGGSDDAGSPDALQACLDYCHELEASNCAPGAGCADGFCEEQIQRAGPACEDEFGAAFACYTPFAGAQCGFEPPYSCVDEIRALEACTDLYSP